MSNLKYKIVFVFLCLTTLTMVAQTTKPVTLSDKAPFSEELTIPQFAHIPLIYDIQGKKLSKRKHAVAVSDYQNQGYLSDAIFNYLLHLGWNDGTEKEIYSKEEAIKAFDISRCGKSPSRFDFEKLKNINLHYIKQLPDEELLKLLEQLVY